MPGPEVILHRVVSPQDMDDVLEWIDSIELTRPKKSLARDFSDGVLVAQLLQASIPKLVELHNYIPSHGAQQKKVNWDLLNRRVLSKLKLKVGERAVQDIIDSRPGAVEPVLWAVWKRIFQLPLVPLNKEKFMHPRPSSMGVSSRVVAKSLLPPRNRPVSVCHPEIPVVSQTAPASNQTSSSPVPQASIVEPTPTPTVEMARKASSRAVKKTYLGMAPPVANVTSASDENNNSILDEIPKILYRGQEMVDYNLAIDLIKKNSDLMECRKELERRITLAEKLIDVKEKRIVELSKHFVQEKRKAQIGEDSDSDNSNGEFYSPMTSTYSIAPTLKHFERELSPGVKTPTKLSYTKIPKPASKTVVKPNSPVVPEPASTMAEVAEPSGKPPRRIFVDI